MLRVQAPSVAPNEQQLALPNLLEGLVAYEKLLRKYIVAIRILLEFL